MVSLRPFIGSDASAHRVISCGSIQIAIDQTFVVSHLEELQNSVRPDYADFHRTVSVIYPDGFSVVAGEDEFSLYLPANDHTGASYPELRDQPGVIFQGLADSIDGTVEPECGAENC